MKKQTLKIGLWALGLASLAFVGCKKIETVEPTEVSAGTATIKGIVYINTDQAEEEDDLERAGSANVLVTFDGASLSQLSDGDQVTKSVTATTNADGEFSVSVPATYEGITYTVDVDQYTTSYTLFESKTVDGETKTFTVTKEGVFARQSQEVSIKTGQVQFIEFNYGSSPEVDLSK